MPDQKQKFLCCTRKQIAILSCPRCRHLLGYCRACSTLFHNLQDLSFNLVVDSETAIACTGCQFAFPAADLWQKYLAARSDLVDAGLGALISEELQLRAEPKEESPIESYRNKLHTVGWSDKRPRPAETTRASLGGMSRRTSILVALLLFTILVGGAVLYYQYFFRPKPPLPPPVKPLKPKR